MSKEQMVAFIQEIDEQLRKNRVMLDVYAGKLDVDADLLTLNMLTRDLVIVKKAWVDMLLDEYGVFYVG